MKHRGQNDSFLIDCNYKSSRNFCSFGLPVLIKILTSNQPSPSIRRHALFPYTKLSTAMTLSKFPKTVTSPEIKKQKFCEFHQVLTFHVSCKNRLIYQKHSVSQHGSYIYLDLSAITLIIFLPEILVADLPFQTVCVILFAR